MKLVATLHDRGALEDAKKKLLDKHYKSQHIQKWKGDDFEHKWEKLGIEPGIGRKLADNVGAFARKKKPAHAVTHMPPPRSSTASTRPLSPMGLAATPMASTTPSSQSILDSIEEDGRYNQKEKESYFEDDEDLDEAKYNGAYDEDYEYT